VGVETFQSIAQANGASSMVLQQWCFSNGSTLELAEWQNDTHQLAATRVCPFSIVAHSSAVYLDSIMLSWQS